MVIFIIYEDAHHKALVNNWQTFASAQCNISAMSKKNPRRAFNKKYAYISLFNRTRFRCLGPWMTIPSPSENIKCGVKQNKIKGKKHFLPSIVVWKEKLSEKGKQTAGMTATSNTME